MTFLWSDENPPSSPGVFQMGRQVECFWVDGGCKVNWRAEFEFLILPKLPAFNCMRTGRLGSKGRYVTFQPQFNQIDIDTSLNHQHTFKKVDAGHLNSNLRSIDQTTPWT